MKISYSELQRQQKIKVAFQFDLTQDQVKKSIGLISCSPVNVNGVARIFNDTEIHTELLLTGTMQVACTVTGKPIKHDFEIETDLIFSTEKDSETADLIVEGTEFNLEDYIWTEVSINVPMLKSQDIVEKDEKEWSIGTKEPKNNPFESLKDLIK